MEPPEAFLAWCYSTAAGSALLTQAEVVRRGLPDATKLLDVLDGQLHAIAVYTNDARKLIDRTRAPSLTAPAKEAGARACSFCGKKCGEPVSDFAPDEVVRHVVEGPGASGICDACVLLCMDVLRERGLVPGLRAYAGWVDELSAPQLAAHLLRGVDGTPMPTDGKYAEVWRWVTLQLEAWRRQLFGQLARLAERDGPLTPTELREAVLSFCGAEESGDA